MTTSARVFWRFAALLALLALHAALGDVTRAHGEEDEGPEPPDELPVTVTGTIDASESGVSGWWPLKLKFEVREDIELAYQVQLRLRHALTDVAVLDHSPDPTTPTWKAGQVIEYEVPIAVPSDLGLEPGARFQIMLGFHAPRHERTIPPANAERVFDGRMRVLQIELPDAPATDDPEVLAATLAAAKARASAGDKGNAWSILERGIRRAVEDETKYAFRDAMLALGPFDARPVSSIEQAVVGQRIARERRRYLRLMSGRFFDRGNYHAALRILEHIGGMLSEAEGQAVIGAVSDAQRTQRDILDIKVRILADISAEDKETAQKAIDASRDPAALLAKAKAWAKDEHFGRAYLALRDLSTSDSDVRHEAREALDAVEKAWLAATPPEQARMVDEAMNHPAFERLDTVVSHSFIYIGPKGLVEGIPAKSRLRFDIAYVFLTDLFGRRPNPGGDRVTVFYKELWDFGGGQGGGKIIDIGRAKPEAKGTRVDTGLLYHELTHCVDDTMPILAGFREGLANFGAAYCFEALGQTGDSQHSFMSNLGAFQRDYVQRNLPYWRMPGYGPSAGFFLHFVRTFSRKGRLHDWKPYRKFFREYREAPIRDGREPYVARALAYYLIRAFGPGAFDELRRFRFPLRADDREAISLEMEAFAIGVNELIVREEEFGKFHGSPLPRDLWMRRMLRLRGRRDTEAEMKEIGQTKLGILYDWRVVGPFAMGGADPLAAIFPPQREIDFTKEYPGRNNVAKWRKAGETGLVGIDAMGWVSFNYNYQDNTATYALVHVRVPGDTDAVAHVRADDDVALFVNDRLIDRYINRGTNGSTQLGWRGPYEKAPDGMRLPVKLRAGRNKVLVKVKNRWGEAGFVFALAGLDGQPIEGLTTDLDPAASSTPEVIPNSKWKNILKHRFTKKSFKSRFEATVGKWVVKDDALRGEATDKRVGWRKYTVRPGFPKDSPSNLIWIKEKLTKELGGLRLRMEIEKQGDRVPKMVVTIQGEGESDGLSGWNLILHGREKDLRARLERYDNLVYQIAGVDLTKVERKDPDAPRELELVLVDGLLTVRFGGASVFDAVPLIEIPGKTRIGWSTYGPQVRIARVRLDRYRD